MYIIKYKEPVFIDNIDIDVLGKLPITKHLC